jgi:hypothetical protein
VSECNKNSLSSVAAMAVTNHLPDKLVVLHLLSAGVVARAVRGLVEAIQEAVHEPRMELRLE